MFLFASPPLDHDRRDQAGRRELLADAFAGEGWEVPTLLAGMAEAPDFSFDRLSQVHLGRWSKGRVALAASTASGQGTGLALVGAYVLAAELARHDGHDEAFTAYERRMRPFA
ncbi:hypothetical protein LDL08_15420 [Nonomuraea glycinis]|uniref:FAD-binding domain-containing protein n=1 Tax=Nonomuraea glycinis TaxID=2047744 RepID=A0A918E663_9ACTN|nr:hypothetical protein [Nonomuraea glycinis]MCA2177577.1 hypothetical protein [Nonomuraea glycinis]GGP09590.1 hypothetical protein GCM10012278_45890 [Nonomuraea glycinis]